MRLLLDTHVLLWWLEDSPRLPKKMRTIIRTAEQVFVSPASAWEISIKSALGKLAAPENLETALADSHFLPLPISIGDALDAGQLARLHEDPFDRMLVAQARRTGLRLLTLDHRLAAYGVAVTVIDLPE